MHDESELVQEFRRLVAQDRRIEGLTAKALAHSDELSLQLDGKTYRFALRYLLTPTVQDIPDLPKSGRSKRPLLVVPRLSDAFLDACQKKRVSVADLNGRVFLRGPGLLVSLSRISGRNFRFKHEPRSVFVGKSVRIVRSLLSDPERIWRQAELIERTGATSGLVSRIVTHLTRQGFLEKTDARRFRLVSPLALLDAWATADDFGHRATTHRFSALNIDAPQLARQIRNRLAHEGGPQCAFTQWIAAWLRHPYTEPPVVSLYVSRLPAPDILDALNLRPVSEAGRVWFHLPADAGVFRETRIVDGLPLVCDAQIYLDLLDTGMRGPDQAEALREWSGFLHP